MADQTNNQQPDRKERYFRSNISALSLHVAPANTDKNEVAPHTVRFTPVTMPWAGNQEKFGFLKTSNRRAIEMCEADPNVEEIDQKEYDKVFEKADDPNEPNVRRAAL